MPIETDGIAEIVDTPEGENIESDEEDDGWDNLDDYHDDYWDYEEEVDDIWPDDLGGNDLPKLKGFALWIRKVEGKT